MSKEFTYTEEVTGEIVQIPVEMLRHHPDNPRKDLGDLTELAESIKAKGILQNLTVVPLECKVGDGPLYEVVIGNRRMEAAKIAGLETLPCIITDMGYAEQIQTMLLENMQRTDLTVYEQAQGFQMMMDFGDTIETVAEKTGFSTSTIRRRLKMAELDAETLKSVSDRQISLSDFDTLAKIDDLKTRNKVLEEIGTNNFRISVERAISNQNLKKNLPKAKKWLKELGAKEMSSSDTYSSKYEKIGETINLKDENVVFNAPNSKGLFYNLDDYFGLIRFYKKVEKKKAERRPAEEIEKEKIAREAESRLKEAANTFYNLRKDFASSIKVTAANKAKLFLWAAKAIAQSFFTYSYCDSGHVADALGIDRDEFKTLDSDGKIKMFFEALDQNENLIPKLIWAYLGDSSDKNYYYTGEFLLKRGDVPTYKRSRTLDLVYEFLCDLGYEMSDDEIAMQSGTSKLFLTGDITEKEPDKPDETDENIEEEQSEDSEFDEEIVSSLKEMYGAEDAE